MELSSLKPHLLAPATKIAWMNLFFSEMVLPQRLTANTYPSLLSKSQFLCTMVSLIHKFVWGSIEESWSISYTIFKRTLCEMFTLNSISHITSHVTSNITSHSTSHITSHVTSHITLPHLMHQILFLVLIMFLLQTLNCPLSQYTPYWYHFILQKIYVF